MKVVYLLRSLAVGWSCPQGNHEGWIRIPDQKRLGTTRFTARKTSRYMRTASQSAKCRTFKLEGSILCTVRWFRYQYGWGCKNNNFDCLCLCCVLPPGETKGTELHLSRVIPSWPEYSPYLVIPQALDRAWPPLSRSVGQTASRVIPFIGVYEVPGWTWTPSHPIRHLVGGLWAGPLWPLYEKKSQRAET